jgi:uncharacterized protein YjbI with pentapeptide repeats
MVASRRRRPAHPIVSCGDTGPVREDAAFKPSDGLLSPPRVSQSVNLGRPFGAHRLTAMPSRERNRILTSKPPSQPEAPDLPQQFLPASAGARLNQLSLEGSLLERVDFAGQRASDVRIDQCRLVAVDLSGGELFQPLLQDTVVFAGSWANLRTKEMRLRRAELRSVRMTGVDLSGALLEDVVFDDCRIDLGSFAFAKLSRVAFRSCRLDEVDFSGAKLQSVSFIDCVLVKALWTEAKLTRCEMRGSDLSGSGSPQYLKGVRMSWPDVLASAGVLAAAVGIEIVE